MGHTQETPTVCPACGARAVVRIIYGYPGPELVGEAERGEVVLGGCVIVHGSKVWACRACAHRWGFLVLREEDFEDLD